MYNPKQGIRELKKYSERITASDLVNKECRYLFKLPHHSDINTGKSRRREKKLRDIIERGGVRELTGSDDLELKNSILNFWLSLRRYCLQKTQ